MKEGDYQNKSENVYVLVYNDKIVFFGTIFHGLVFCAIQFLNLTTEMYRSGLCGLIPQGLGPRTITPTKTEEKNHILHI